MEKEIHINLKDADDQSILKIYAKPITEDQTLITFTLDEAGKNFLTNSLAQTGLPYRTKPMSNNDFEIEVTYKKDQKHFLMPFLFDYVIDQLEISNPNALHDLQFSMLDYCEYKLKTQSFNVVYDQLRARNKTEWIDQLPSYYLVKNKTWDFNTYDYPLTILGIICDKQKNFCQALLCYAMANNKPYINSAWWNVTADDDSITILSKIIGSTIEKDPKSEVAMSQLIQKFNSTHMEIFLEYLLDNYHFDQTFKLINSYVNITKHTYDYIYRYLGNILLSRGFKNEALLCFALYKDQNIAPTSLMPLLGNSSKCMVYGTSSSKFDEVISLLNAYNYSNFPFFQTFQDMSGTTKKHCKNTITRLIAKNYELALENKPLIPLLFCVSYEDKQTNKKHEIDVAQITSANSSITSAELRHCYRLVNEMPPDIQAIASQTIKFIHVSKDGNVLDLKQVDPFWVNTDFKTALNEYKEARASRSFKNPTYSWRQYLLQTTYIARERFGFFNPDVAQDNTLHINKRRRLS